jgi:hypothetical protein
MGPLSLVTPLLLGERDCAKTYIKIFSPAETTPESRHRKSTSFPLIYYKDRTSSFCSADSPFRPALSGEDARPEALLKTRSAHTEVP